jgi:hypothetical protein
LSTALSSLFLCSTFRPFQNRRESNMSSSRATGPLLGRLAATAGAAMRGSSNGVVSGGAALGAIVESLSKPSVLFAGLQRRPHATSSWIKVREREDFSLLLSRFIKLTEREREREREHRGRKEMS